MRGVGVYLRGVTLFVAGIVVGTVFMQPGAAQEKRTGLRLNHVGIAVKDYDASLNFYTKVMGYHIAFKFPPSPDGKPTTTYFQISKDTFLEMAPASDKVPAGVTHMGIETSDIKSTIAQLRAAGGTVDLGIRQLCRERVASVQIIAAGVLADRAQGRHDELRRISGNNGDKRPRRI